MNKENQRDVGLDWDTEIDVIVIGTGFSGLSAAIEAFDANSSVVILEKRSRIGGNSIIAYGCMNAVYPEKQNPQSIDDSIELHTEHTWSGGDYRADPERIRAIVAEGAGYA